jgi:hypothetical protein
MQVLPRAVWPSRAAEHEARVDQWIGPHLSRRRHGVSHPVEDFLFTYYRHRPAALRRWHPGFGTALTSAESYRELKGYEELADGSVAVGPDLVRARLPLIRTVHALLSATAQRPANFGCFGMHEWAMVYRLPADDVRHSSWPLRLGSAETDRVVEAHRIACSHFDAFRFFTPDAVPLNALRLTARDRSSFEQPGCLHAGMDLYKHAYRLSPMVPSELVADCFELARDIRSLDMRASPYDLRDLGYEPVEIETAQGKARYTKEQRAFGERGAALRARLVAECEPLLAAPAMPAG